LVLGSGHSPVSWVAANDIARAAAMLATALQVTVKRQNRMPAGLLRLAGRAIQPFNAVTARQLLLGALLDTQPQVVDATATWRQLGIAPITFRTWQRARRPPNGAPNLVRRDDSRAG
jgi:hypothetical protein